MVGMRWSMGAIMTHAGVFEWSELSLLGDMNRAQTRCSMFL